MFQRHKISPRKNWQNAVASVGMDYHTIDGKEYWNESACYELSSDFVDKIEEATQALQVMCEEYVTRVVTYREYDEAYQFTEQDKLLIEKSWQNYHPTVLGRFDLGVNKSGDIKMFEYNADTPTSLLEASVVQWNWLKDYDSNEEFDQFNSIHEKLISFWNSFPGDAKMYFTTMKEAPMEDWGNLHYLLETAASTGLTCSSIDLEHIGWSHKSNQFVDSNDNNIEFMFKLYPWEWMRRDEFYSNVPYSLTKFIEPPWKMLLSNKLLNVKLWEMFPNNKYLLESHKVQPKKKWWGNKKWIKKPMLGREGRGVGFGPDTFETIAQEYFEVVKFDSLQPVIGSWVINGQSAGIGIREDVGITTNNSQFVPHYFK